MSEDGTTIRYLNTDLDLTSPNDLTAFATSLEGKGIHPLHVTRGSHDLWYATFETAENLAELESSIAAMLDAIESLDGSLRQIWNSCVRCEFNIGYDCGNEPWAFNHGLSNALLRRMSKVGGALRTTLYPERDLRKL